jgi:hypothetical protein
VDGKGWVSGQSDLSGDTGDSLDFGDRVDHGIPCNTLGVLFLPLSEVCESASLSMTRSEKLTETTNEFSENNDVDTLCDFGLERRVLQQSLGSEVGRTNVGIKVQRLPEPQDTLLRSNRSDTPLGSTNSSYPISPCP